MKKDSLLRAMIVMAKAEDTDDGEKQFNYAFAIIEKKVEKTMIFIFTILSATFLVSAFIEFRGMLDFIFRIVAGSFFTAFCVWRLNVLYGSRPARAVIRFFYGSKRERKRRR